MKKKWVLRHHDLDFWSKVSNFNRIRASAVSNHLAKTASKSVHPFSCNFVHKKHWTHIHTDTHTQTNCSENITPPRFRGGVNICKYSNMHICESSAYLWCRLLYCTLVPGIMSVSVIVCKIWPLVHLPVTFIVRQGHFYSIIRWMLRCCVLVPSTKFVGSIGFEIWTIV